MTSQSFENWICKQVLGRGSFGQVELWIEKYTQKQIAIKKCMLPNNELTSKLENKWKQEIQIMSNLKHPSIVKIIALPRELIFEFPVLCMEYCNKGNLRKALNDPSNACGLIHREVLSVMKDISSAVEYLHYKNITHRDLKPENIVLHEKDQMILYKLIDLGLAKELGNKTTTGSLVGTFNYVAPELFRQKKYTSSVDYWSLGILFFEVLTGYKPFIPYRENFIKWIKSVETKNYKEICAREIDKEIRFYDSIIHPTDLSESILEKLAEWFRIILQSNPKQRGKRPSSDEVVVFSLLKEIIPKVTVDIFLVTSYYIDQYNVYNNFKLSELQQWIEQKTKISINKQLIVNIFGCVLNEANNCDELTLNDFPDLMLYVYNIDSLEVSNLDGDWKIPEILNSMLIDPEEIQNRILLRECYTAIIFIMRYEIHLYRHYVYALCTKRDIINKKLKVLNHKIEENLPFLEKVNVFSRTFEFKNTFQSISSLPEKIENVHEAFINMKSYINHFDEEIDDFFNDEKLIDDLQKYSQTFENFLDTFRDFESKKINCLEYISDQVNTLEDILGEFEEQRKELLSNEKTKNIARKLVDFEQQLNLYTQKFDACIQQIKIYEKKISEASNEKTLQSVIPKNKNDEASSLVMTDDKEIRDNVVLRALFDVYLQNIQENISKLMLSTLEEI